MMKRILVVDDDEAIRKLFLLSLEGKGFQINTAGTGKKAIEIAKQVKYDLIFLDLKMPGMNGIETLRELRKINMNVPIYIITAFHEEFFNELKSVEEDGIDFELLKKPFDTEQLISVANEILE
ncbi:response regulator [candidate division WOR-3 bacterium]|nr:response regulator [candidate division WOR-3 bacterium]